MAARNDRVKPSWRIPACYSYSGSALRLVRQMGLYIVQLLSLRHQSINRELPLLKSPAPLYIRRYSFPLKSRTDHHPTKVYRKAIHGSG